MKDDTIKKCQFCRLANELDSEEIKFWSKKAGNYSPYPEMITCDSNYNLQNDKLILKEPELKDNSLEVKLTLGKDNSDKYVYYWASNPQKDIHKIYDPESAYGKYENHGLQKCDEKGEVTIKFNTPQPYKEDKKTHPRHIHYLLEGPDKTWLPLKTIRIICSIPLEYLDERIKNKDTYIINALPEKYYEKNKIPESYNLPTEILDKMTNESKCRKIKNFLKEYLRKYPLLDEKISEKTLVFEDIPIITYCAHSKCDASEKLVDHLYECGFNNVYEYKGGIEEYNKKRSFFPNMGDDEPDDKDEDIDKEDEDEDEEDVDEESEEDELEEEDEYEDYIDITHEGIEYYYLNGMLYDEYLEPIGEAKIKNDKIIEMDDKCKKYHRKQKGDDDEEDSEDEIDTDDDEDSEDDDGDSEDEGNIDKFTEDRLNSLKGGKGTLKKIVKEISQRKPKTYTYGDINKMKRDKLVEIALTCQGKRVCSKKSDYKYKSESEIESMNEGELKEMLNSMINREPGTFKYSESSWTRDKLMNFILTCQGSSKPKDLGVVSFVGGGWCL